MVATFPRVRYGVNLEIVGKVDPQKLSYTGAWQTTQGHFADLAEHISKGHPWMPALLDGNGNRWQTNANYAEVIGADFDEGMTIAEAIAHPFISAHAGLGIESASSRPEHQKFRVVFRLPHPVEGWETIRICNHYLINLLGVADPACKDASRFFFGAPGRTAFLLNEAACLPESFVNDALAWHQAIEEAEARRAEEARRRWEEWRSQHSEQDADELILKALDAIDPNCSYNEWIAVGMALAGMGDQWFHAWDSWSANGAKYNAKETASKWKSFRGKEASPSTIFGIAKRYGFQFPRRQGESDRPYPVDAPDPAEQQARDEEQERVEQSQRRQAALDHIERCFKRSIRPYQSGKGKGFGKGGSKASAETPVDPSAGAIVLYDSQRWTA